LNGVTKAVNEPLSLRLRATMGAPFLDQPRECHKAPV
jgi:hypothetical protein